MRTQIPGHLYYKGDELVDIVLPQRGVLTSKWSRDKDRFVGKDIEALTPYLTLPKRVISGTFDVFLDDKYVGECHILTIKNGKPVINMIERNYL